MKENLQPPIQHVKKEELQPDHLERFDKVDKTVVLEVHGLPTTLPVHKANTVDL